MNTPIESIYAGHLLVGILGFTLVVLALRLADEHQRAPRNHLIIFAGAGLAFGLVYRIADVLENLDQPRWSTVVVAGGVAIFLLADQRVAHRAYQLIRRALGRGTPVYTGPERRRGPRLGTDPDEDFPRDGAP